MRNSTQISTDCFYHNWTVMQTYWLVEDHSCIAGLTLLGWRLSRVIARLLLLLLLLLLLWGWWVHFARARLVPRCTGNSLIIAWRIRSRHWIFSRFCLEGCIGKKKIGRVSYQDMSSISFQSISLEFWDCSYLSK